MSTYIYMLERAARSERLKGSTKNDPVLVISLLYIKDFSPPLQTTAPVSMIPCILTINSTLERNVSLAREISLISRRLVGGEGGKDSRNIVSNNRRRLE